MARRSWSWNKRMNDHAAMTVIGGWGAQYPAPLHCYRSFIPLFSICTCWPLNAITCSMHKEGDAQETPSATTRKRDSDRGRRRENGQRWNEIQPDRHQFYCCYNLTSIVIMSCSVLSHSSFLRRSAQNTQESWENVGMIWRRKWKKRTSCLIQSEQTEKWFLSKELNAMRAMIDLPLIRDERWSIAGVLHTAIALISQYIKLITCSM